MNEDNKEIAENTEKCEYVAPELIRLADIATATQNNIRSGSDGLGFS